MSSNTAPCTQLMRKQHVGIRQYLGKLVGGSLAVGLADEAMQLRGAIQQLLSLGAALMSILGHLLLSYCQPPGAVLKLPLGSRARHMLICTQACSGGATALAVGAGQGQA